MSFVLVVIASMGAATLISTPDGAAPAFDLSWWVTFIIALLILSYLERRVRLG